MAKSRQSMLLFPLELEEEDAKQLLDHVLKGEGREARDIFTANPQLLLVESTAKEYASGFIEDVSKAVHRQIKTSPLRAMAATGLTYLLKEAIDVLGDYVDEKTHQSGLILALEQFSQQFPDGYDYPESHYDFSKIISAISVDQGLIKTRQPNNETIALIQEFRKDFMPTLMCNGYFSKLNDLIAALKIYKQKHDPLDDWKENQLSFFWCRVIGYLERLVTAIDAQVISQGVAKVMQGKPLKFSFELEVDEGSSFCSYKTKRVHYFPLDSDLFCRMGLHFAVDGFYHPRFGGEPCVMSLSTLKLEPLEEYIQEMQREVEYLCSDYIAEKIKEQSIRRLNF